MTPVAVILLFAITCLLGSALTALVCRMAVRLGLSDKPDRDRKLHGRPTPLGGGIAVFAAFAVMAVMAIVLGALSGVASPELQQRLHNYWPDLWALLAGSAVIVIVGLVDDCIGLRVRQKLLGQILAAAIVVAGGLMIRRVEVFGWQIELDVFSVPFTFFWLLGAINALNLLDGVDGLAATVGLILVSAIGAMSLMIDRPQVAIVAMVFAGSLLGFLRFNFPPARVFLGDAGSMLIGLVVGTLAIQGSLKGAGTVLLAAPLAVWTIPVFDTAAAILRRKLTGRSIYATDRSHLHHRLLDRLGSNRKVLAWLAATCALTSAAALISVFSKNDLIALLTCAAIVTIFIVTGVFGRVEFLLLGNRLRRIGLSLIPRGFTRRTELSQATFRLRGSRRWDPLFDAIVASAEKLCLRRVQLDLNLPSQESYHAAWERHAPDDSQRCWRLELPLVVADQPVGHLAVFGERNGETASQEVGPLLDVLEGFEMQLATLTKKTLPAPVAADGPAVTESDDEQEISTPRTGQPGRQERFVTGSGGAR